ncbi:MAG: hypothetical protein LW824_16235 [Algoriphagus sp.]|jgi:hypothetical protein|nr:hypothetical protein [Algoriphagus sp.]MCE2779134.1 hypothetical protein [Algoriphagus sp.]
MKNATWMVLILFLSFPPVMAQKLDSILSRSTFSFNYGISHDFFACCVDQNEKLPITNFSDRSEIGQVFGFEYTFRPEGKNEYGFGFSKDVNFKDHSIDIQTSFALIQFDNYRIRGTKNFHYLLYKRHFIEDKLIGAVGIYNLHYRDPHLEIWGNSDQTVVMLSDEVTVIDFGIFAGLEYYHSLRKNFQVGLRTRLFYTQGYDESFESFELTPVLRFRLN